MEIINDTVDHIDGSVTEGVRSAVLNADDGDEFTITQVCWDCGATCERTVQVSVEHK